jgi:3-methyladenine DNA glycosylase AlkD
MLLMLFLIGTFGLNFPIFISTMSVTVFHAGAGQYGLLTSMMAVGSVAGALLAARREKPHIAILLAAPQCSVSAARCRRSCPTTGFSAWRSILIGVSAQTFTTTVNSMVQMSTEPAMRGRVVAILLAIALGGTPIGGTHCRLGCGCMGAAMGAGDRRSLGFCRGVGREPAWPARLIAYEVVACHAPAFAALNDRRIEAMAKSLSDWGSIDLFGVTISGPAWLAGTLSTPRVQAWTRSRDKWRRRLALVSTVALNVSSRGGRGDAARTLRICARLVRDRDPAIVKALSWALRALAKREPQAVKKFIAAQRELLAALVQREVRNVLESGTKRPAKPRSARV